MARALAGRRDLETVHVIAHGAPGEVYFASGALSADSVAAHAADLAAVGARLGRNARLMFWSCETGQGERGQDFVAALASASGARVAAATRLIGAAGRGGSWELDTACVAPLTAAAAAAAYTGVMAANYWIGGAGRHTTDWSNKGNWSSTAVPAASDDIVIDAAGTVTPGGTVSAYQPTISASTNTTASSLTLGSGATLTFSGTYTLTLGGTGTSTGVANSGTISLGTGTITTSKGTITNNTGGAITITTGTLTNTLGSGTGINNAGGTITIGTGTVSSTGTSTISNNANGQITISGGTLTGSGTGGIQNTGGTITGLGTGTGAITASGAAAITANGGTLEIVNGITDSGSNLTLTVTGGSDILKLDATSAAHSVTFNSSTGTLELNGDSAALTVGSAMTVGAGTVRWRAGARR
jgi:collagen type VII alpha